MSFDPSHVESKFAALHEGALSPDSGGESVAPSAHDQTYLDKSPFAVQTDQIYRLNRCLR